MAEQLFNSLMQDADGDGKPDLLDKLLSNEGFSAGIGENRRRITFLVIYCCFGLAALIIMTWAYLVIIANQDIGMNNASFGSGALLALLGAGTAALGGYLGAAQVDAMDFRKNVTNISNASAPITPDPLA